MSTTWPILITVLSALILSEIYFIAKYLQIKQEIFQDNFFSGFSLGFVVYFVITFAVFLPLIIFEAENVSFVILFFIKDGIIILFLVLRWQNFWRQKTHIRELFYTLICGVIITITFNLGISQIRPLSDAENLPGFQPWSFFKETMAATLTIPTSFISEWMCGLLVGTFGFAVISAALNTFARRSSWLLILISLIITTATLVCFNFERTLEALAGNYLIIFALINIISIVIHARRRFGAVFGLISLATWSFNPNYFFGMLVLAFVGSTIYVILKRPKPLLIWTQMVAPLAIVSTLWINDFSKPLGAVVTSLAVLGYVFIISVGRLESLAKIDKQIYRLRYLTPLTIFLIILFSSLIIALKNTQAAVKTIESTYYLIDTYQSEIASYVQYAVLGLIALVLAITAFTWWYRDANAMRKPRIAVLLIFTTLIFAVNPALATLTSQIEILRDQQIYLSPIILPVLTIILSGVILNKINPKLLVINKNYFGKRNSNSPLITSAMPVGR